METGTFTVIETAKYLGIGRNKMYELVGTGVVPYIKLGKQIRIPKVALEQWLLEQSRKPYSKAF